MFCTVVATDAPIIPIGTGRVASAFADRSDDELMTLAAAGVVAGFSALVRRHERGVRGFCAKMLGTRDLGDDVAQEVFIEVWRTCRRYQGQGRFRGFLFSAARNRCLNELRTRRLDAAADTRPAAPGEADVAEAPDQIDALLAAERQHHLERTIRRLPPKLRDAVLLRFSAELDYDEIAAIVERPEETVRGRVFQGLKRLRVLLDGGRERK